MAPLTTTFIDTPLLRVSLPADERVGRVRPETFVEIARAA
ncbi:hypothetical protein SGUI_2095 [Serinicoccus hydrothermalis]|uniref:Uncharacterized protein n=1 Tax=Serinicoccus hydrothermalis TaxID=1758689 RepID=A0A1B1NDM5_9MICO|nr:hypothetical protein SGUI_2095 [Serinicoccus hydrothermalis]